MTTKWLGEGSCHCKETQYKLNTYSLLKTQLVELFQLMQEFVFQQALFSFQFVVSNYLGFQFLHIYTVRQLCLDRNNTDVFRMCQKQEKSNKHSIKQREEKVLVRYAVRRDSQLKGVTEEWQNGAQQKKGND